MPSANKKPLHQLGEKHLLFLLGILKKKIIQN